MLNKRYYELNEIPVDFLKTIDFCIVGICKEERTSYVPKHLPDNSSRMLITVEYDIEFEKYIIHKDDKLRYESSCNDNDWKDLIPNFIDEMKEIGLDNKKVTAILCNQALSNKKRP